MTDETLFTVLERGRYKNKQHLSGEVFPSREQADEDAEASRDFANRHWPKQSIKYAVCEVRLLEQPR